MIPQDIENTIWYQFSEKAKDLELSRTYTRKQLEENIKIFGFDIDEKLSNENVIEHISIERMIEKLEARSYEILYHLDDASYEELLKNAVKWIKDGNTDVTISSSLFVFRRR